MTEDKSEEKYFLQLTSALVSLARHASDKPLGQKLESEAVAFYCTVSSEENNVAAVNKLGLICNLLMLGEMTGDISYEETGAFYATIERTKKMLIDRAGRASYLLPSFDIGSVSNVSSGNILQEEVADLSKISASELPYSHSKNHVFAERTRSILDTIMKSGNMAMKEIAALFPEVSERTLRYDLQKLCEYGVVERMGNGGPSSYYRASDKGTSSTSEARNSVDNRVFTRQAGF